MAQGTKTLRTRPHLRIRRRAKRHTRSLAGNIAVFLMLALFGVFMALPLVYAVVSAFKPMEEIFLFPPRFFVRRPVLDNFSTLSKLTSSLWVPFSRYLFNSVFVSCVATAGHILLASAAAYAFGKFDLKIKWMFSLVVMALLFNGTVLGIPQYIVMTKLHIVDSYLAYILPALPAALGLFLMKQFMEQIPDALIEAARIDGASHYRILWSIVMPTVRPAWLTLMIFTFQSVWNAGGGAVIYSEELKLVPTAISQIAGGGVARTGAAMAGSLILMIPPIVIFILAQSSVIETMAYSGIKD